MVKQKKRIGMILSAFIVGFSLLSLSGGGSVYALSAADFTDVASHYWGYHYIDFSAGNGIINGYRSADGTYRFLPENAVTLEESAAMLYRALSAAGKLKSTEDFTEEYADLLIENEIADWAKMYIAYGLKYELIAQDEIAGFTDESGRGIPAKREQAALWTAKALEKNLTPAYSLIYADLDSISAEKLPYIDLLYRQGIMQGDDKRMFHPSGNIKRAEFAAICSRVFESAQDAYAVDKEVQSNRGTIISVDSYNNKIMMTQSDGSGRVIRVNPKTQIVIDGKVNYNGIAGIGTGTAAVVAWGAFYDESSPDEDALQLHVITKTQTRKGLLTGISEMGGSASILEIENEDGDSVYYVLDKNSMFNSVPKNGKVAAFIADGVKILEIKQ